MKIIAVSNQKGGVAKTTTSDTLAAGLTLKGYHVLAIDLDPQGNLSYNAGIDTENDSIISTYQVLKKENPITEAIIKADLFDIVPANILLAGAEQEVNGTGKEYRLRECIESISNKYDFIVIDTPPSLGVLTVNAFTSADFVLIPSLAEIYAAQGIKQLHDTVQTVKKYCNPKLEISGVLLTRYNARSTISKTIKELTQKFGSMIGVKVYKSFIRDTVSIKEAQAVRQDIFTYAPNATAALDYAAFIDEFLKDLEEGI